MKTIVVAAFVLVTAGVLVAVWLMEPEPVVNPDAGSIDVTAVMSGGDTAGYRHALQPEEFVFPRDHGAHRSFKTEWWYFTGNLTARNGRRFGFQLTFFRSALSPDSVQSTSHWATNHLYMAHFALSDIDRERFYSFEQFARAAAGLAGVQAAPFRVWLYDWQAQSTGAALLPLTLSARDSTVAIQLTLDTLKPLVLQGDRGLSRKGYGTGNASYYYSLTRMSAAGTVEIDGEEYEVDGTAWLDREWSTSALEADQAGWDWFALQLANGADLMYYQLRTHGGGMHPLSAGVLVSPQGEVTPVGADDVQLDVLQHWRSPWSQARYPAQWRLRIPAHNVDVTVTPLLADQELQVSVRYWEGAVGIEGTWKDGRTTGRGYVEMTGYGVAQGK